jgi:AcrR family transcriptional regulator
MAEVIGEQGYAATTLEDVAARMGTSRAVIYYQFRNKEDLYVEICMEAVTTAIERLEQILAEDLSPAESLREALRALISGRADPIIRAATAVGRPRQMSQEARQRLRHADRRYEALFQGIIERGIEEGAFTPRDPKFIAYTLIFAINGAFVWRRPDGPLGDDYFIEELSTMLMNGVLAHPCEHHAHETNPSARRS